jgi:hypothetical protein
MYKSFMKALITLNYIKKSINFIISKTQSASSPRAGEDAAKRQVRGLAKSINRNAQTQSASLSLPFFPLSCQREGRVRAFATRAFVFAFAVIADLLRNLKPRQLSEVSNV